MFYLLTPRMVENRLHPLVAGGVKTLLSWPLASNAKGDGSLHLSERVRRQTVLWFWVSALLAIRTKTLSEVRKIAKEFLHLNKMKKHYLALAAGDKNDAWLSSRHVRQASRLVDTRITRHYPSGAFESFPQTFRMETMFTHPTDTFQLVYATRAMFYGSAMTRALNSLGNNNAV